ncbi:hypothetical protein RIF29_38149 [Crotalaria pallida]|uniref:Uncharacterized protein n=1 Tax=Crotalaria pallida TaxID=3830 RepID=A0AAN9E0L4_CROPI
MKLETDHMLFSMNEANRIYLSIQEPPPASHDPDLPNVDGVVPTTSRERDGLERRRRHEPAVERPQQTPMDRQLGMYYAPQPYPYYASQALYETYFYPRLPESAQIQQSPPTQEGYIPSSLPHGYIPSPQYHGYMPMPQMQGYNTPSPYDPMTSTLSALARWDRESVSPSVDFYELAGTSAPQIDLNTKLFDESNDQDDNQGVRRNPHRGARDRH